jgi:hypothetical protein
MNRRSGDVLSQAWKVVRRVWLQSWRDSTPNAPGWRRMRQITSAIFVFFFLPVATVVNVYDSLPHNPKRALTFASMFGLIWLFWFVIHALDHGDGNGSPSGRS